MLLQIKLHSFFWGRIFFHCVCDLSQWRCVGMCSVLLAWYMIACVRSQQPERWWKLWNQPRALTSACCGVSGSAGQWFSAHVTELSHVDSSSLEKLRPSYTLSHSYSIAWVLCATVRQTTVISVPGRRFEGAAGLSSRSNPMGRNRQQNSNMKRSKSQHLEILSKTDLWDTWFIFS